MKNKKNPANGWVFCFWIEGIPGWGGQRRNLISINRPYMENFK